MIGVPVSLLPMERNCAYCTSVFLVSSLLKIFHFSDWVVPGPQVPLWGYAHVWKLFTDAIMSLMFVIIELAYFQAILDHVFISLFHFYLLALILLLVFINTVTLLLISIFILIIIIIIIIIILIIF